MTDGCDDRLLGAETANSQYERCIVTAQLSNRRSANVNSLLLSQILLLLICLFSACRDKIEYNANLNRANFQQYEMLRE